MPGTIKGAMCKYSAWVECPMKYSKLQSNVPQLKAILGFVLGFIPLPSARYDLVILKEYLEQSPVQQFIKILGHRLMRSQSYADIC